MALDATAFIMAVEQEFNLEIPNDDYASLTTVGSLCDYILARKPGSDPATVWKTVQRIASEEFRIPPDEIKPGSRWVDDLMID
ncbi:MAG: hypothetical protein HY290_32755 [Planctomycetia bacterium]|nr:hypothetical protein [Planctomycetia bacterium]